MHLGNIFQYFPVAGEPGEMCFQGKMGLSDRRFTLGLSERRHVPGFRSSTHPSLKQYTSVLRVHTAKQCRRVNVRMPLHLLKEAGARHKNRKRTVTWPNPRHRRMCPPAQASGNTHAKRTGMGDNIGAAVITAHSYASLTSRRDSAPHPFSRNTAGHRRPASVW
jgi:hypothetical protein